MNYRINVKALTLVLLVVAAAFALFAYTMFRPASQDEVQEVVEVPVNQSSTQRQTLTAKHQVKDGTHTLVGTLDLPTPCHQVTAEPFFVGESGDTVEVRITTATTAESCAQVVTARPYKVTFAAPPNARITALLNGVPVTLNLMPVGPEEDLDAFDVNVKG